MAGLSAWKRQTEVPQTICFLKTVLKTTQFFLTLNIIHEGSQFHVSLKVLVFVCIENDNLYLTWGALSNMLFGSFNGSKRVSVFCALCTVHYALWTVHFALCIVRCAQSTVLSVLCTHRCELYFYALWTVHIYLCTVNQNPNWILTKVH